MQEENSRTEKRLLKYLITAAVGLIVVFAVCWLKGVFQAEEARTVVRIVCDAFTFVGLLLVCFGFLTVLNKAGAFDGLAYSMKSLVRVFRNYRGDDESSKSYYDYKKAASEKRKRAWHLVIVGAGFLVVAIILVIVHGSMS